jgi:hypothetical protein
MLNRYSINRTTQLECLWWLAYLHCQVRSARNQGELQSLWHHICQLQDHLLQNFEERTNLGDHILQPSLSEILKPFPKIRVQLLRALEISDIGQFMVSEVALTFFNRFIPALCESDSLWAYVIG